MSSTKYSKPYESVSRTGVYSSPHLLAPTRDKLVKLIAITVILVVGISALHALLTPKDLVHGLMIDAGSTGSRIHTYTFRRGAAPAHKLDLLYEDFYPLKPGLSAFKDDPVKAAESLKPLLERARAKVPASLRENTPVVLRATAGLRMVGEDAAEGILKEVRTLLKASGFLFEDNWASILGGNEEAVYSWMTVNYLLEREVGDTVGTLEMGGGSAQVAFVPRDGSEKLEGNCSTRGESVEYGGKTIPLYTTSHLDFGLHKARAIALDKFEKMGKLKGNACVNKGGVVEMAVPFDDEGKKVEMDGEGSFEGCRKLVEETVIAPVMGRSCECDLCTYKGAAQPEAIGEYVAIAFYLERTISLGLRSPLSVKDIRGKAEEVCGMTVEQVKAKYAQVPNGAATDLCFDLSFITLHLEKGHGITEESGAKLIVVDKIKDVELGWCLGAMQQALSKLGVAR